MTAEKDNPTIPHKIHKTHFPVIKIPLKDTGQESGFEWVDMGNGHWKRMPKEGDKKKEEPDKQNQTSI